MKLLENTEPFISSKNVKRLSSILLTGMNAGITPVLSLVVSYIVIHHYGAYLWGDFVEVLLWLNIAAHICFWGSKEFLIRKFSEEPAEATENWQKSFKARVPFVFLFGLVFVAMPFNIERSLWMCAWLFFRFIYQSYEPVITWKRKFEATLTAELIAGIFLIAMLQFKQGGITSLDLLQYFAFAEIIKAIIFLFWFRSEFTPSIAIAANFTLLKEASPFFLIGFAGLLHSRTDQLLATHYLASQELAFYQLMMSLLLLGQSVAYIILQPFVKNLYRLSEDNFSRISLKLLSIGAIVCPLLVILIGWILNVMYSFEMSNNMLIASFFFLLPFFYYITWIYSLYKLKTELKVLWVNLAVIILNIAILPFLFPKYGIEGVLIFSAALQVLQGVAFRLMAKAAF